MARCFGDGDRLYEAYHDHEWGRPLPTHLSETIAEQLLFERISLEAFQSGLSWITILRKRPAFRRCFADFDPATVAAFSEDDVARLMAEPAIVRNHAKITATITNAQALLELHTAGGSLAALLTRHTPPTRPQPPADWSGVPASTPESVALAADLVRAGFRFVGPITAYSAMQALGIVNDHVDHCPLAGPVLAPAQAIW